MALRMMHHGPYSSTGAGRKVHCWRPAHDRAIAHPLLCQHAPDRLRVGQRDRKPEVRTVAGPLDHRIDTPDGRVLAVAEWGDPAGQPLVAIHGTPGSRLGRWRDPAIYLRAGVRRITFDRAGYGLSTRRPGRRVADVIDDVLTIAGALGVDRFAVTGRSGGGPHALACAALLPGRVTRCAAVVAIAPFDAVGLDWFAGQTPGNVAEESSPGPAKRRCARSSRPTDSSSSTASPAARWTPCPTPTSCPNPTAASRPRIGPSSTRS